MGGEMRSEVRNPMTTDAQKKELQDKVNRLVAARFGGDYTRAFGHYDQSKDGKINRAELLNLLADAGIGNWLTRGAWADGIIAELDTDKDGRSRRPSSRPSWCERRHDEKKCRSAVQGVRQTPGRRNGPMCDECRRRIPSPPRVDSSSPDALLTSSAAAG
jgi:hypothetical protein